MTFLNKKGMATRLGADNTGDSGPVFKVVVRLCGLAAIAGVFLPFLMGLSIIDMVKGIVEHNSLQQMFTTAGGTATNLVLVSGYLFFPLFGLVMVFRGKYAGGPLTFLLLFNLAAFLLVHFFGTDAGITGNFFVNTGLGYWIACGGLFAPFVAMFFLDKSI
jgi:hypothetical protein